MRITDRLLTDKVIGNIRRNTERVAGLQEQVASGKRLTRASDDPTGTARALILHSADDETQQAQRNLDLADGWLNVTDVALQSVSGIVQRVRELTVQGASKTLSAQEMGALANEVDQLIDHAMQLANTRHGDRYIFGGFQTKSKAYDFADPTTRSAATYFGDDGEILRAVAPGVKLGVNIPGNRVFDQLFETLIGVRDDMRAGTAGQDSLSLTRLDQLDDVQDIVLQAVGEVGAKGARLDITKNQLSAAHLNDTALISQAEDVDMSDAIINLSAQQAALQAALATGARVIQPKLMDFLR